MEAQPKIMDETSAAPLWEKPFGIPRDQKREILVRMLQDLTEHHVRHCDLYRRVLRSRCSTRNSDAEIAAIPFLPVRLFKHYELRSIDSKDVFKILMSSGTTSQVPSRIFLDRETAALQTRALVRILQDFLGKERRPMLLVDSSTTVSSKQAFSARGAGVIGISTFGRDHVYALDEHMQPNLTQIAEFAEKYRGSQPIVFGFTFMVWQYLVQVLKQQHASLDLAGGVLLHSGGWKKLADRSVDAPAFKRGVSDTLGIERVHNFYGMVEQIGTIFVECAQGVLHAPTLADVIIRDPLDWRPLAQGEPGVIQVLSILPSSYPGHSLLTEDLGVLLGEDDCPCGRLGRYFAVLGRVPTAEMRGCSDTHGGTV